MSVEILRTPIPELSSILKNIDQDFEAIIPFFRDTAKLIEELKEKFLVNVKAEEATEKREEDQDMEDEQSSSSQKRKNEKNMEERNNEEKKQKKEDKPEKRKIHGNNPDPNGIPKESLCYLSFFIVNAKIN